MMGQGIAYVSAMSGIEVVLLDANLEAAERGKGYSQKLLDKRVAKGSMTKEAAADKLAMIKVTSDFADLAGVI
jgi:3-hydroxyacyl-CoA dehydrogenase/enoyl-CoA hydratase/3-hydroxybutyryl-CoA epimerase